MLFKFQSDDRRNRIFTTILAKRGIARAIRETSGWNRRSLSPLSNESSVQHAARLDGVVNYATCTRPARRIIACGYMRTKHSRVRRFEGRLESRLRKNRSIEAPLLPYGGKMFFVPHDRPLLPIIFESEIVLPTNHLFLRLLYYTESEGNQREIENWKTVLRCT